MKKYKGIIPKNRTVHFFILIAVLLSSPMWGCASAPIYPSVPFAVQHAGTTMVQDVKLVHDRNYELYLRYYHGGAEDSKRVAKLTGSGAYRIGESGERIYGDTGIPVYLELKIMGLDEVVKGFYFEERLYVGPVSAGGVEWVDGKPSKGTDKAYIEKIIKSIRLKPGLYRITLKSLRDIPELKGTSVAFKLGWYWNSQPFD
jgi:hypothetical protein